jgi:hypothetical protein
MIFGGSEGGPWSEENGVTLCNVAGAMQQSRSVQGSWSSGEGGNYVFKIPGISEKVSFRYTGCQRTLAGSLCLHTQTGDLNGRRGVNETSESQGLLLTIYLFWQKTKGP